MPAIPLPENIMDSRNANGPHMADPLDLVIVGAGPGGYVAAIRAAQLGLKTAIVERSHLGGICLNWGCIPTKALLKSGEIYEAQSRLGHHGVSAHTPSFDLGRTVQRSRDAAKKLSAGVAFLMKKNKVPVVEGTATLAEGTSAPQVRVTLKNGEVQTMTSNAVILATGARPLTVPAKGLVPDGNRVWTYREAMVPGCVPQSMAIVGAGAIGIEFASFYRSLGTPVVVIEAEERILPSEDPDISAAAQRALERRGMTFRLGAFVNAINATDKEVRLDLGDTGVDAVADVVILALGVTGNVEHLGLEALGVNLERGHVITGENGKTNVDGLYAIGDVAGPPWLAHKASHEGIRCVEYIAGVHRTARESPIPRCVYSEPQIASVGLTEAQARATARQVRVGRYLFRNNGKAVAAGDTDGFIKVLFDADSDQLLGAHLIGPEVTELVQGFVIAMTLGATGVDLIDCVFPHPTLSEVMHEAILAAHDVPLHM
jgi:dihydrolipoamide dehydrogenase